MACVAVVLLQVNDFQLSVLTFWEPHLVFTVMWPAAADLWMHYSCQMCVLRLSKIWPASRGIFACLSLPTQNYYWCMKSNTWKMVLIQQNTTPNCTELLSLHWHLLDLMSLKPRHRWCTCVCYYIRNLLKTCKILWGGTNKTGMTWGHEMYILFHIFALKFNTCGVSLKLPTPKFLFIGHWNWIFGKLFGLWTFHHSLMIPSACTYCT